MNYNLYRNLDKVSAKYQTDRKMAEDRSRHSSLPEINHAIADSPVAYSPIHRIAPGYIGQSNTANRVNEFPEAKSPLLKTYDKEAKKYSKYHQSSLNSTIPIDEAINRNKKLQKLEKSYSSSDSESHLSKIKNDIIPNTNGDYPLN